MGKRIAAALIDIDSWKESSTTHQKEQRVSEGGQTGTQILV